MSFAEFAVVKITIYNDEKYGDTISLQGGINVILSTEQKNQ